MNHAVRERYPSPAEALVASVVNLSVVPPLIQATVVRPFLSLVYRKAASDLPPGADPEDYVLILPDRDGFVSGKYGAREVDRAALVVVVDEDGVVKGRHQGENLAEAALEMLE